MVARTTCARWCSALAGAPRSLLYVGLRHSLSVVEKIGVLAQSKRKLPRLPVALVEAASLPDAAAVPWYYGKVSTALLQYCSTAALRPSSSTLFSWARFARLVLGLVVRIWQRKFRANLQRGTHWSTTSVCCIVRSRTKPMTVSSPY